MMTALESLLETYRTQTATQRDKGTAFEKLIAAWLVVDPVQSKRIAKAELWSDWAKRHDTNRADVGIDLVCTRHDGGLAAVQCKLYDPDRRIQKSDIDSFISASAKDEFAERLYRRNDRSAVEREGPCDGGRPVDSHHGLSAFRTLRESRVDWSLFAATGDIVQEEPKTLRDDQVEALEDTT